MEEIVDIVLEMHNEKPETCTEVIKNPSNNDQMKTAMQELHEWAVDKWSDPSRLISLYEVVNKIGEMLQKEKEQIVNAYKEGCFDGGFFDEKWDEERAEEYYNETYGGE
jgi:type 1 glutamine amidotransferase